MTRYSPRTGLPTEYQAGPFDASHLYLQWGGKLPGSEEWSCGVRLAGVGAVNSGDPAAMIAGCVTAIQTFHTSANSAIHSTAKLSFVKLNMINTDGKYALQTTFQTILADIAGGAVASASIIPANQVALAISLTTAVSRGPAHRGRFYIPMPTVNPASDGLLSTGNRDAIKGTATTLLNSLNAVSAGYKVAVFSRKQGNPFHRDVTGIAVGRVLDTQRRRRRRLLELY